MHCDIDLFSTPFPMQTTNHTLVPLPVITNHTPPINSPYQPQAFCVNVGPQLHAFPNPLNHAQVGPFPLPLYQPLQLPMIKAPNLFSSLQHVHNFHLKLSFTPLVGVNLLIKG
jgi:hypothetical protein